MSRIGGASDFVLVIHNTDVGGGGDPNFFRGGSKGVGDPLIPGNQSSCIARGGGGGCGG